MDVVLLAFVLIFALLTLVSVGFAVWQLATWQRYDAIVVRHHITRSTKGRRRSQAFYHPVVRFRTEEGEDVLRVLHTGTWTTNYDRGTRVVLLGARSTSLWMLIYDFDSLGAFPATFAGLTLFAAALFYFVARS